MAHVLERAGITKLDAIVATHSHFDHAMDVPEIARQTGTRVLGSKSTRWICRGWGLPDDQFRLMDHEDRARFGSFEVTFVKSRHVSVTTRGEAHHEESAEELTGPLVPPVHWSAYPEGRTYDVYLTHPLARSWSTLRRVSSRVCSTVSLPT